jgi:hypothetical protein
MATVSAASVGDFSNGARPAKTDNLAAEAVEGGDIGLDGNRTAEFLGEHRDRQRVADWASGELQNL